MAKSLSWRTENRDSKVISEVRGYKKTKYTTSDHRLISKGNLTGAHKNKFYDEKKIQSLRRALKSQYFSAKRYST